jgi:hypothetical protein
MYSSLYLAIVIVFFLAAQAVWCRFLFCFDPSFPCGAGIKAA